MNVSAIDEVKIKHLPVHDELIKVEVFSEGHTIFLWPSFFKFYRVTILKT